MHPTATSLKIICYCVFVSVNGYDVNPYKNSTPTGYNSMQNLTESPQSHPHTPLLEFFKRALEPELGKGVNWTDNGMEIKRRAVAMLKRHPNSRQFQERKLDFAPDLNENNDMLDSRAEVQDDLFMQHEAELNTTSRHRNESDDLGTLLMFHVNPVITKSDAANSEEHLEPEAVIKRPFNLSPTPTTAWDLLKHSNLNHKYSEDTNSTRMEIGKSNETSGNSTEDYDTQTNGTDTRINLTSPSPSQPPTIESSATSENDTGSMSIDLPKASSLDNSNANETSKNISLNGKPWPEPTKETEIAGKQKKKVEVEVAWIGNSSTRRLKGESKKVPHIFDALAGNVKPQINALNVDNEVSGTHDAAITAPFPFLNTTHKYESTHNGNYEGQSQFFIPSVQLNELLSPTKVATASLIVLSVMALSTLFAGTAPFWQSPLPFHPQMHPDPYEFPFYRRQFSHFNPLPLIPPVLPPLQEQMNKRSYYDSFPYNFGLRRKRSTL